MGAGWECLLTCRSGRDPDRKPAADRFGCHQQVRTSRGHTNGTPVRKPVWISSAISKAPLSSATARGGQARSRVDAALALDRLKHDSCGPVATTASSASMSMERTCVARAAG